MEEILLELQEDLPHLQQVPQTLLLYQLQMCLRHYEACWSVLAEALAEQPQHLQALGQLLLTLQVPQAAAALHPPTLPEQLA